MRSQIPSEIVKVLNYIERGILSKFNEDDIQLFYGDYRRRAELLKDVANLIPKNAMILDAGSSPGFNSLALKMLGYDVISVDINPEPYKPLLERLGIKVIKVDLENESIPLNDESVDCVVFTEVLEHLHPFKITFTLSEINRTLKMRGYIYISRPLISVL
jgi:SAM-dependent methyltransferase